MRAFWSLAARAAVLVLGLAGGTAQAQQPPPATATADPPPVEPFFDRASFDGAALSPSGRWLAWVAPAPGRRNALVVQDLEGDLRQGKPLATFTSVDIDEVHWINDDRLVFDIREGDVADGNRRGNFGLFSVRRDGSEVRQLVRFGHGSSDTGASRIVDRQLSGLHQLVHVPATGGNDVVVAEWRHTADDGWHVGVLKRLDVVTGLATSLSVQMPSPTRRVLFAADGTPRLVVTLEAGRERVFWRDREGAPWRQIADHDAVTPAWQPRQIASDGSLYVTQAVGPAGESQLFKFDFGRGAPAERSTVSTPGFDFSGEIVAETEGGRALGVRTVTDAESTTWFDPVLAAAQDRIDALLPGRINRLSCRRCGTPGMTVLVRSWSDREPGEYWVWRAADEGKPALWLRLARVREAVDARRMGTLDLHRIRSRDDRDLPVWVTRPAVAKPGDKRPAVVLVHGGPWVRGVQWEWSEWPQFLASRGYVVVEPEFRGSTGYGAAHHRAGFKQWGLAMQDDVADAARWAAAQAGVDPDRVCIMGASYGGYSALMGLVRDPQLYRCGVAWVAVTEPRLLYEWRAESDMSEEARRFGLPALLGDPKADAARFDATSPVLQAAGIRAPLLLAFGGNDRRVPLVHGERLRDALAAAGRKPEWVVYGDEGHGFVEPAHRIDFARRVERFLAQQLR